jgi:hypothetical protein
MYDHLRIDDDPTVWVVTQPIEPTALTQPGAPLVATVGQPLNGTLLVSRRAAAFAVLYSAAGGPIPTDAAPGPSYLYLPTLSGLNRTAPGYALAAGTNLATLQAEIAAAMTNGTSLAVPLSDGEVVLNGAALPFAAIFKSP